MSRQVWANEQSRGWREPKNLIKPAPRAEKAWGKPWPRFVNKRMAPESWGAKWKPRRQFRRSKTTLISLPVSFRKAGARGHKFSEGSVWDFPAFFFASPFPNWDIKEFLEHRTKKKPESMHNNKKCANFVLPVTRLFCLSSVHSFFGLVCSPSGDNVGRQISKTKDQLIQKSPQKCLHCQTTPQTR